ncbi:MAG TPA: hypothetical protein VHD87_12955 [Acidimicrobiales bacterium]|nr:hypothetical protein [Acidimicrobiales bacterium]
MGSWSARRPEGVTARDWFRAEILGDDARYELVDFSTCAFNMYAAVRDHREPRWIFGVTVLVQYTRDGEITWKTIDEFHGPADDRCPQRVLNALTPLDEYPVDDHRHNHEWASDWRRRCQERQTRLARARKVKPGDIVRFARPLQFTDGTSHDTFEFVRRNDFRIPGTYSRYRISNWRETTFTYVDPHAA